MFYYYYHHHLSSYMYLFSFHFSCIFFFLPEQHTHTKKKHESKEERDSPCHFLFVLHIYHEIFTGTARFHVKRNVIEMNVNRLQPQGFENQRDIHRKT